MSYGDLCIQLPHTETPGADYWHLGEAVHLLYCWLVLCLLLVLREFAAVLLLDSPEAASVVGLAAALLGDTPDDLLHHFEVLHKSTRYLICYRWLDSTLGGQAHSLSPMRQ